MRLSPAAELAIRGAVVIAQRHGQGPITLETICSSRDLPRQYLVKIFSSLAKAGLITAVRGKRGGYMLALDPEQISLLAIIEAVEGPILLNLCQHDPPKCQAQDCAIRPLWSELQETVRSKLSQMTLAHCITPLKKD